MFDVIELKTRLFSYNRTQPVKLVGRVLEKTRFSRATRLKTRRKRVHLSDLNSFRETLYFLSMQPSSHCKNNNYHSSGRGVFFFFFTKKVAEKSS